MNIAAPVLTDESARLTAMTAHDRSILVEAGAGSGKTAIMAGRLALLLASGAPPRAIAAVTFTELAASELLARVRDFVDELLDGTVPRELRLAWPNGLSEQARARLEQAAASIDEITCSTIHGFCQRLITPYPVEANIDPGASVMDPAQADLTFEDSVDRWLRDTLSDESGSLISELVFQNPEKAAELVRSAAAALRSNRTLIGPAAPPIPPLVESFRAAARAYVEFLANTPAREEESVALATRFAEMADDIAFAGTGDDPATTVRLLTSAPHPDLCTAKGTFSAYRKKGKWGTAAKAAGLSRTDGESLAVQAEQLHQTCCSRWTELLQAVAGRVLAGLLTAIQPISDRFRDYKRSAALLDFDDLIHAARDLLRDHAEVRTALAERYRHVLVDEFQDTDPLQTEILWRLCGDPAAGQDRDAWPAFMIRPGALFLVGDPKQAIYRFRGADVSTYVRARDAIRRQHPDNVLSISTNFRSCASILTYVNKRFEPHMSVEKGQPGFTALDAFHSDHEEGLCVAALAIACAGEDGKASSEQQRDCEAEAVAEICGRLIGSQIIVDRKADVRRPCRPGDIGLLAPTGAELWRYEEALERRGIPVATQAGKGFYRRQEIQDIIAVTRVLADSRDTLALGALLRGPLVGLTEEQLLDIVAALPRDPGQPDALPRLNIRMDPGEVIDPLARDIIEKLQLLRRRINATTPHQLISEAVDVLRIRPLLIQRHRGQAERPLANVDLYLSLAKPYAVRGLRAFAEAMSAAWEGKSRAAEGRPDAQEEAVSLFTIHAAKGLEWPIVVPINTMTKIMAPGSTIVDRETRRLFMPVFGVAPAGYTEARDAETAELDRERLRLWYVAATRARELLILPKPNVGSSSGTWSALIDLGLDNLPLVDLAHHPEGFETSDGDPPNNQSREIFANEAVSIVAGTSRLEWVAPSRAENVAESPYLVELPQIRLGPDDDSSVPEADGAVQGGRERGFVLHKLLEEVLTGETVDDPILLTARADDLIRSLAAEPEQDSGGILSATEIASTVLRTLSLPEIAAVRARLISEFPVYASEEIDGVERAISGIVDAMCVGPDGKPELVIDWKSDVKPDVATVEHYRSQVRRYLEITGVAEGLVVFVTTGEVMRISEAHSGLGSASTRSASVSRWENAV